ncbi:MAG: DUF2961 domain-containing protein [Pirellulales bacterium]|nr:DUF2961 domain-containing protein [Pirellulales bacterium]
MKTIGAVSLAMILSALGASAPAAERAITFESLLAEMVDRDAAARFPDPAYTCRQASSYDRASVSPDDPGAWQANNDRSFFLRSETNGGREESVMLDAKGPGCVVRFWATSGNPIGNIRVYIDGAEEPVINEPAKGLVGGDALVGPPLSKVRARGMNLYLPIPYAKSCKITYDRPNFHKTRNEDDLLYYQINYRTYQADAKVQSFSREVFDGAKDRIAQLQEELLQPPFGATKQRSRDGFRLPPATLRQGDSAQLAPQRLSGPAAVVFLAVRLKAEDLAAAARSTVLSIQFDGEETVWCPVGDFFGSGVGVNPYQGWWRSVGKDGWMACFWVMPFQKSCRIDIRNLGQQFVEVEAELGTVPWNWDERSMYFHTNWRLEYPIDASVHHDWNYVQITGKGVYMGDTLAINNPVEGWWGEGDEKIYFDGQQFPSHFGTGTEDYYGYAWCTPEFFESPFHSQPLAEGPRNKGHVTNTRVRLLDGIPFTKDFRFDMEVWHWVPVEMVYAATTYWYGLPGAKGNYGPMPEKARVFVAQGPKPRKVEGAIEGETLKILERTGGSIEVQEIAQHKWSDNKQLWWLDGKPGDKLVLALDVQKAGKYALKAELTKAIDYGIVRLSLDDKPLGQPIDLVNDGVIRQVYSLGTCELSAGPHRLTIEIVGSNPKAVKRHMFGLDYVKLEPAQ